MNPNAIEKDTSNLDGTQCIKLLRERCLKRKEGIMRWRDTVGDMPCWKRTESLPLQRRRGKLVKDRLERARFAIDDLESLAGRMVKPKYSEETIAEAQKYWSSQPPVPGQTAHCEMDVEPVFELGINGLLSSLENRLEQHADDASKHDFYRSLIDAAKGLSTFIMNARSTVVNAMETASDQRRTELEKIASSCERIAAEPPETFRDAIQLLWFIDMATMYGDAISYVVPGRMDRTLRPFYERDLAASVITRVQALLLIEALYLLINDFVPDGGAMSVMVGGRDKAGNDMTNDLSYLCVEALRRTALIYPTVGICWHEGTPMPLVDLGVDLIANGLSTPAFFGDEVIQKGLKSYGLDPDEACNYINSTCVEITPCGSSNVWVASPYFSLCKVLLDEVSAQVEAAEESATFEDFMNKYRSRLSGEIEEAVCWQSDARIKRRQNGRKPFQSLFTRDCIERGRDIDDGGARHNWIECSFVGLANLADSLQVVRKEIYRKGNISLAKLKEMLDVDFDGYEDVQRRIEEEIPKYGENNGEVEDLVKDIVDFFVGECRQYRVPPDDSPFIPGTFTWVMHERLGAECGATPDGRRAGKPFADGGGPAQGCEKKGPTSAILSTTCWDHSPLIGGLAYNMKFNADLFDSQEAIEKLRSLILTYLHRGGFETQLNVVSGETLRDACNNPERYRDLVVRIGGYTDYFTRLSDGMQKEIIQRTEYGGF